MLRIPVPQRRERYARGVYATTNGTTLKVRLSVAGLRDVRQAAEALDMPAAQFMQQVIEAAAREVCNDRQDHGPSE